MAEEKILIPPYKRAGACERCGADIYAPDLKQSVGGWPLMSACVCPHGPKIAGRAQVAEQKRAAGAKLEEQAQAA
jgi:hypothetical protein